MDPIILINQWSIVVLFVLRVPLLSSDTVPRYSHHRPLSPPSHQLSFSLLLLLLQIPLLTRTPRPGAVTHHRNHCRRFSIYLSRRIIGTQKFWSECLFLVFWDPNSLKVWFCLSTLCVSLFKIKVSVSVLLCTVVSAPLFPFFFFLVAIWILRKLLDYSCDSWLLICELVDPKIHFMLRKYWWWW